MRSIINTVQYADIYEDDEIDEYDKWKGLIHKEMTPSPFDIQEVQDALKDGDLVVTDTSRGQRIMVAEREGDSAHLYFLYYDNDGELEKIEDFSSTGYNNELNQFLRAKFSSKWLPDSKWELLGGAGENVLCSLMGGVSQNILGNDGKRHQTYQWPKEAKMYSRTNLKIFRPLNTDFPTWLKKALKEEFIRQNH